MTRCRLPAGMDKVDELTDVPRSDHGRPGPSHRKAFHHAHHDFGPVHGVGSQFLQAVLGDEVVFFKFRHDVPRMRDDYREDILPVAVALHCSLSLGWHVGEQAFGIRGIEVALFDLSEDRIEIGQVRGHRTFLLDNRIVSPEAG